MLLMTLPAIACLLTSLSSPNTLCKWTSPKASVSAGGFPSVYAQSAMDVTVIRDETICRVLLVGHQEGWCLLLPMSGALEQHAWHVKLEAC